MMDRRFPRNLHQKSSRMQPFEGAAMKRNLKALVALSLIVAAAPLVTAQPQPQNPAELRIQRQVRHELLMLPYLGVFDNIAFQVQGGTVTLLGQVVRPVLKTDAQNAVKGIEGVDRVVNNIEVLPPSPMDDGLRLRLFRAIYGFPSMEKYDLGVIKPIRIIVKNGHVTLEGVVDSDADKNIAGIRANSVSGIFSVTNNLQVVPN
jgi:hyperosmotically inducible periplasmic protein